MRNTVIESHNGQLMSKTQHYRKVTKPLLERKRRARMNQYLDELKNLIVETMEAQGEHITKLEKADILEMTVTYLKNKSQSTSSSSLNTHLNAAVNDAASKSINPEKFRAGYTQAAYEVSKVFASVPGLDVDFGTKLMKHLGYKLKDLQPPSGLEQQQQQQQQHPQIELERIRSPSPPSYNQFGYNNNDKSQKHLLLQQQQQDKTFFNIHHEESIQQQCRTMSVITPPQSPNLINQHQYRPSVVISPNFQKIHKSQDNKNESNDRVLMDKLIVVQQQNQQDSGDVWRPW